MNGPESPEMRALDAALAAVLRAPELPPDFDRRLAAALRAAPAEEWSHAARAALEREHEERLAELQAGYVRLRRRTLGTWIGAAFAAGAAAALAMPWLQSLFGANVLYIIAGAGSVIGLVLIASSVSGAGIAGALNRLVE
ncbi:MAG TPA: hypothetical protein VMD49_08985 [Steroidobacteraceae bacterium]|nr:hypothetical protein [Steroidobacteraceae bacterium]